jgi:hypothetical protein
MQHRAAGDLLPVVETALAGEGTASVDPTTNSLVLSGEPRAIAVALQLLAVQDRARRTVRIEAWSERQSELRAAGHRVDWSPEGGGLRIGRLRGAGAPSPARVTGAEAAVLGSGATSRPARSPEHAEFATTLEIVEGEFGRIESGRVVPFVTRGEGGATTAIIETRSGLLARPRVLGSGHAQLDLAPFDGSARVVLAPGDTVVVGGVERQTPAEGADTPAASHRGRRDEALLLLRIELE